MALVTRSLASPIWSNTALDSAITDALDDLTSDIRSLATESIAGSPTKSVNSVEFDITPPSQSSRRALQDFISQSPRTLSENEDIKSSIMDFEQTIRCDWLGTSQFYIEQNIADQQEGGLAHLIVQRKSLAKEVALLPYDPIPLLTLGYIDTRLGFTDILAANAYRALLLIDAAFDRKKPTYPKNLGDLVLKAISVRLRTQFPLVILDELQNIQSQAYCTLITGLLGCGAFWDGLKHVNKALKVFPGDRGLEDLKYSLREGFLARNQALPAGVSKSARIAFTRTGKIYQKPYPWVDSKLYHRNPKLIRDVNKFLAGGNCEVRRAFFGPNAEQAAKIPVKENEDVGPLGIFATRDISKGEIIMIDKSVIGISNIPSSRHLHCDACHASLSVPYTHTTRIVKPKCCKAVAFCSNACHDTATKGYHKVLCGKDFDWLYKDLDNADRANSWSRWRPIMFLRVMAVVIADFNKQKTEKQHPLSHPLITRMTAAYALPDTILPRSMHDWQFFENLEAPTKILMQLGINIFTSSEFTPEVIQTIFWRIENNANQSTTRLIPNMPPVSMVVLNPNYLFFNHSCDPNVSWHGTIPDRDVSVEWLRGVNGDLLKPGESAVSCTAGHDIKKGEECKISYIGDPLGVDTEGEEVGSGREEKRAMLEKWCEMGCGCRVCEAENVAEEMFTREQRSEIGD